MTLRLTFILCLLTGVARAQTDAPEEPLTGSEPFRVTALTLIVENDSERFQIFGGSDRWYTNGVKLDLSFNRPWPGFTSKLLPFASIYDDPREAGGVVVAQQMFTPEDLEESGLLPDDQPYSGYLYAGLYVQRSDRLNFDHLELDLGVVGQYSGAEAAQSAVHAALPNQIEPAGWDNQLSNEFAINLTYEHRWRTPKAAIGVFDLDAIAGVGGRLGNVHIDANVSGTVRFGYNLPDDFGPPLIDTFRDATGTWSRDFGIYAYARATGQAVARNIFIDGNTFADSHSVDREDFVATLQAGLALRYKWFETGWSTVWQSEQFEQQPEPHEFGSIYATLRFTY